MLLYNMLPGSVDETLTIEIKAIEQQLFTNVYFAVQGGLNFRVFRLDTWKLSVWPFKWQLSRSTLMWFLKNDIFQP